ncbi:MAG: hypothetical protein ACTSPQ_22615 [Candidatus Helarchaeota archaeon]
MISSIIRAVLSSLMILGGIFIYIDYRLFYKNKRVIFRNTIRGIIISIISGGIGLIGLFIPLSLEYSGGPIYLTCVYFEDFGNLPLIFHSLIWLYALAGGVFTWISLYLRSKLINNKNNKINESKMSNRKSQDEYLYHLKGIGIILIYISLAIHMLIYIYLFDGISFDTILTNAFTTIILTIIVMKSGDLIIKNHYLGNKICIIGGIIGVIGTFVPIQVVNEYLTITLTSIVWNSFYFIFPLLWSFSIIGGLLAWKGQIQQVSNKSDEKEEDVNQS